jgi:8-oxo-dGTP pyrophosphatase MutT (NUDIX family)
MEERSAGAVLYNDKKGFRRYVLLYNGGHWDFPKGNMEKGENEEQTAIREVREETGLDLIAFIKGYRKVIEYFYRRDGTTVHKKVVFLLAKTDLDDVRISSEHQAFGWFNYAEALQKTTHVNSKKLLVSAERFVRNLEFS